MLRLRRRTKDLSGVAHHSIDFIVDQRGTKCWHPSVSAVDHDNALLDIGQPLLNILDVRANASTTICTVALRASHLPYVLAEKQLLVSIIGQYERFRTPGSEKRDGQNERTNDRATWLSHPQSILNGMGLDPTRPQKKTPFDYAFVVGAVIAGIALVAWALLG